MPKKSKGGGGLQSGDKSAGQPQDTTGSSSTRSIKDFDARARQEAEKQRDSGDSPGSAGDPPEAFKIVDNYSHTGIPEIADHFNKEIAKLHDKYSYKQEKHLESSKAGILETAKTAYARVPEGERTAYICGLGHGYDTPLQELAEMSDHITVVDFSKETAKNTIRKLPRELQEKITLVVDDVSGVNHPYISEILAISKSSKNPTAFCKSAQEITRKWAEKATTMPPNVGNNFAFACSPAVASQLLRVAKSYLENEPQNRFLTQFTLQARKRFWKDLFAQGIGRDLESNVQKAHIDHLASSIRLEGKAHITDTPFSIETGQVEGDQPKKTKKPTTLNMDVIKQAIKDNFPTSESTAWTFDEQLNTKYMVASWTTSKQGLEQLGSPPPEPSGAETPLDASQQGVKEGKGKAKQGLEQLGSPPPEQSGEVRTPDVSQQLADKVKKKKKKRGRKNGPDKPEGNPQQLSSPPPEQSGVKTPSDGAQQIKKILEDPSGLVRLKELFQEEQTSGKGKQPVKDEQPRSASPERSEMETPPDVRQQIEAILQHSSGRQRLKELLMDKKEEEEDIDRLTEELRKIAKAAEERLKS